jgi:hypothetical protein
VRRVIVVLLIVAAGCVPQSSVREPAPPYADAGRVIGGHLGTVVLAERCAAAFPDLAGEIDAALRDWRWRNDPIAAAIEQQMWTAVSARGATTQEVDAAKTSFSREIDAIGAGMAQWFAAWPPEKQRRYCDRVTARLSLGEDDLARRFPAEVRRWEGAKR